MGCFGECDGLLIEPRGFSMKGNPGSVCLIRHSCESRNPELDPGSKPAPDIDPGSGATISVS
jgi:hypothetical protein